MKKRPARDTNPHPIFSPLPPPRKPQAHTIFPELTVPIPQRDGTWGEYQVQPAVKVIIPDAAWLLGQLDYQQELREWKIKEKGRQEALREFESECIAQGAAGLVSFARVAGSLEAALRFPWFKNGLQRAKDLQEYDFGTLAERDEAREALSPRFMMKG